MANEKRLVTRLYLDELGTYSPTDIIMALKPDGRLVRTGFTAADISSGVALESDNVNDADPNINKFVTQSDIDKLGYLVVTDVTNIDMIRDQLMEIIDFDLAQSLTDILDF